MRKRIKIKQKKSHIQKIEKIKLLDRRFRLKNTHLLKLLGSFYGLDQYGVDCLAAQAGVLFHFPSSRLPFFFWPRFEKEIDQSYFLGRAYEKEKQKALMELKKIGCYRGLRLGQGLPMRGQRTHTNAKTIKRIYGKKKTNSKKK